LPTLAADVRGAHTHVSMISVWDANDYMHAMVERGVEPMTALRPTDMIPIKGWPRRTLSTRARGAILYRFGLASLMAFMRRWHVRRRLGGTRRCG
jgi:hypothetical protein